MKAKVKGSRCEILFLANDEHVHHYQRERVSITVLGL